MSEEKRGILGWFVIECLGKHILAGMVEEQTIAGIPFLRIDVPEVNGKGGFTKLLHPQSIFAMTPADMNYCRLLTESQNTRPFNIFIGDRSREDDTPF
jgi:hypothetical protein